MGAKGSGDSRNYGEFYLQTRCGSREEVGVLRMTSKSSFSGCEVAVMIEKKKLECCKCSSLQQAEDFFYMALTGWLGSQ